MKILLKKAQTQKKRILASSQLIFYKKHNLASKLFLFNKENQVEIFFESAFGKSKSDCRCLHFDMIAASLSNILI